MYGKSGNYFNFDQRLTPMRFLITFLLLFSGYALAQDEEHSGIEQQIERFFEGFHQRDTMIIKETVAKGVILQTVSRTNTGGNEVRTESFSSFLKTIAGIPDSVKFKEVLIDYKIRVDGSMANAWTPYEFWLEEQFSHCGVNSFQLAKLEGEWKIIYLIDTRRKEDCDGKE
jgi:hypothetical protein